MSDRLRNGLAQERERRGWTQAQAAAAGGITRQSYAAIESGSSVPSTEVALRLAHAWGVAVEDLFRLPPATPTEIAARWTGPRPGVGRRVRLARVSGRVIAYPAGEGERTTRPADGVVSGVAGQEVRISLLDERLPPATLAVVGCDPAFGIVADALRREHGGMETVWSSRGSRSALEALAWGEAHVAGAHLDDPESGGGNEGWVQRMIPFPCTRVRFAVWEAGLLVRAGNPAGIREIGDLGRPGVRLVNRETGSGSRMLLDQELKAAGVSPTEVRGYETSASGHLAVGEAIAGGLADAGIGIRAAGATFGLEMLPLRSESYELIVPDHFLELPAVRMLLDTLRRPGIRAQVEALQGYDGSEMGRPA